MRTIASFPACAAELLRFMAGSLDETRSQQWVGKRSRTGAEARFNELALRLFELQVGANPLYARFCEGRGKPPGQIDSWREIPAVPISVFKDYRFSTLQEGEETSVFHSSGTTGQKSSSHCHNELSLRVYEASVAAWFLPSLLPELAGKLVNLPRFIFLTPPPAVAPNSSLVHMFETVRRRFGSQDSLFTGKLDQLDGWQLDWPRTARALTDAVDVGQPVLLLGTGFNFVHLLDSMMKQGMSLSLPEGSRVMETGGYKGRSRDMLKAELHSLIEERLGISAGFIVSEYGMSELSSQAYDRVAQREVESPPDGIERAFKFPPWARVLIVAPETGREVAEDEVGIIRILDLANLASGLAIETEDLARRQGPGFEFIGRSELAEPRGCSLMSV